jgi:hypothetical protein
MKKIPEINRNGEIKFSIISSLLITGVIFSVFFAQAFFSDIITFQKSGDNLKSCYPAFFKLGEYINNGSLNGVDVDIFNGATEFFFRSNLPNMYLPSIIFSYLMLFIPKRLVYILFYIVHMVISMYFSQRLAQRFFKLNKWISLLFAISVNGILLIEAWYLSFYIIASLTCPLLYWSFSALYENKKINLILLSLPYVLAITSGYITVSIALVGLGMVSTLVYGFLFHADGNKKQIIVNTLIPPIFAGIFSVIYGYELLDYVKNVLNRASSTIFDTLYYNLNIRNIPLIISSSFTSLYPIEQLQLITIGIVWILIIVLFLYYKCFENMKKEHKILLYSSSLIYLTILLIALGMITPLVLWFYSFIPIFGSMHIPLRYMMVTQPLLYLALCIILQYIPEQKDKKLYIRLSSGSFLLVLFLSVMSQYVELKFINTASIILELILIGIIFYSIYIKGINNKFTIILWCVTIILPNLNVFYITNEVNVLEGVFKERSIIYNEQYQDKLDFFISTLDQKKLYKYTAFDSESAVPEFIPGNYSWYDYSDYNLTNYMGYEPQLSVPSDYMSRFWWFNKMDWTYIANTRGDFAILDEQSIQENISVLDKLVDWNNSNSYIDESHRLLKLKKFIPKHYTGVDFVEDQANALDNGYFYAYNLSNDSLIHFDTDDSTYFKAIINTNINTEVSFLLYPNRYYNYYIDDIKVKPIIDNMQIFIPIPAGEHSISVRYENKLHIISNYLFVVYYSLLVSLILYKLITNIIRKYKYKYKI